VVDADGEERMGCLGCALGGSGLEACCRERLRGEGNALDGDGGDEDDWSNGPRL
jgi:hypothetical protein